MNEFFAGILNGINTVIGNYGWSMVIFTLLFKLIIMPLNYKSRKSMRRMSNLQPQMTKLQKKYENDKEKLNQKMSELYRKEGVNPMSGCLPMILSMAILIIMFNAMRMVANNELASQCLELLTTGVQTNESWLWVKNIWMPDSPFHPIIADSSSLRMIPADVWAKVFAAQSADAISKLAALGIDANTICFRRPAGASHLRQRSGAMAHPAHAEPSHHPAEHLQPQQRLVHPAPARLRDPVPDDRFPAPAARRPGPAGHW